MKQKYAWIFLIALVLIIAIFIYFGFIAKTQLQNQNNQTALNSSTILPNTVTLSIYGDWTSSGGSRNYNSTLSFVDGKLTTGWNKYDAYPGTGGELHYECIVDINNLMWKDKNTSAACGYDSSSIPMDLVSLREEIKNGTLKPAGICMHFDTCYEIIK
jgi:hypothetical protein